MQKDVILIVSEEFDQITNNVIDWIHFLSRNKVDIVRINDNDSVFCQNVSSTSFLLSVNRKLIDLNQIKGYWFRRGFVNMRHYLNMIEDDVIINRFKNDIMALHDYIQFLILSKINLKIGRYMSVPINKLIVLEKAKSIGLKVPRTEICTKIIDLQLTPHIITKSIGDGILKKDGYWYGLYTEEVLFSTDDLKENFAPSLFQEKIDKKVELRVFFFKNNYYSMAIFSQNDPKTRIDFRHYDSIKPNRYVPFNLPQKIKSKLKKLMRGLDLDTGSIDMIYTVDKEYVFLEVNPHGQFGMVSFPCNYKIERDIANYLLKT